MNTRFLSPKWFIPFVGAALTTCWLVPARADTILGIDADYVVPVDEDNLDPGYGFALRGGPRLDLKLLTLTAEMMGTMRKFEGSLGPRVYEGKVGARLGVGAIVRPNVFGHVGLGHARFPEGYDNRTELAADFGLGLDFTVLPLMNLGVHGAYNFLGDSPSLDWATLGGHVEFVL